MRLQDKSVNIAECNPPSPLQDQSVDTAECGQPSPLQDQSVGQPSPVQDESRAFEQQRMDREEARKGSCIYVTFDMQKTLPLPKLSVGEAFYLCQLWLYNAGVHMIKHTSELPMFHIWMENEAKRGPNEVCSALLASLNVADVGTDSSNPPPKLAAWSDSCAGQNFKMLCFFQYLIPKGRFREIEHKFPEPGHTYLDSDRDFGKIEVAVKKRENIFTADEYHAIIVGAFNKPKASVTRMADKLIDV